MCCICKSFFCIFNYLRYFYILFINILIVVQLRIDILFFLEDMCCNSSNLNDKIQNLDFHGFFVDCRLDTAATRMWLLGSQRAKATSNKEAAGHLE